MKRLFLLAVLFFLTAVAVAQQNGYFMENSNYNQSYSWSVYPTPCKCGSNQSDWCPYGYQYYDTYPCCRPIGNPCDPNPCPTGALCLFEPNRCPNVSDASCKRYSCVQECVDCVATPKCKNDSCSDGLVCREIAPTCQTCGSLICECPPPKNVCLSCPEPVCNFLCREGYECKVQPNECFRCGHASCVPRNECMICPQIYPQCNLQCPAGYKCSVVPQNCYHCAYATCIPVQSNDTCIICPDFVTCGLECPYGYECEVVPRTCDRCQYGTCAPKNTHCVKCPSLTCDGYTGCKSNEACQVLPGNCTHCDQRLCVPAPPIYNPSPYDNSYNYP